MSEAPVGPGHRDDRHRAREAALRALYQAAIGHVPIVQALEIVDQEGDDDRIGLEADSRAFAARLADGAWEKRDELDAIIAPHSVNWRLERLAAIDHQVMRLAVHEWLTEPGTPPRVVLSEALELARAYSGEAAVRFVNGVLDAVYHRLRREGRIID